MFSITFTHLTELLALGGRRSEALPFVRVKRAAVARLRRERAQTSIIRNMFDVKATSDDDTCMHAMDHAHGDPQQTSPGAASGRSGTAPCLHLHRTSAADPTPKHASTTRGGLLRKADCEGMDRRGSHGQRGRH